MFYECTTILKDLPSSEMLRFLKMKSVEENLETMPQLVP